MTNPAPEPAEQDTLDNHGVPRILHLTSPTMQFPDRLAANIEALRHLNPGWDIRVHTDRDIATFIAAHADPRVRHAYASLEPRYGAARADLFRYLVLNAVGGAYLDMKSTCTVPLDRLAGQSNGFLLAQWDNDVGDAHFEWGHEDTPLDLEGGEFIQWFLMCRPGHPLMQATIDLVLGNIASYSPFRDGTGKQAVLKITGPIAYTQAVLPLLSQANHRRVRKFTECGLVYSVYEQDRSSTTHRSSFGTHYTKLTIPLTRQSTIVGLLWNLRGRLLAVLSMIARVARKGIGQSENPTQAH